MNTSNQNIQNQEKEKTNQGLILVLGLILGSTMGLIFSRYGMGLALGLALANLVQAVTQLKARAKGARLATGISALAVLIVIGLWIWVG